MLNVCCILQGTNKVMYHLFVLHCSFCFLCLECQMLLNWDLATWLPVNEQLFKLGPGQVASSEGMVVVASCPEKWNLLQLGAPVLVHRSAGDEVKMSKSFQPEFYRLTNQESLLLPGALGTYGLTSRKSKEWLEDINKRWGKKNKPYQLNKSGL